MRVYTYKNCGTCRKAVKWLRNNGIDFTEIPIRETPPSLGELKTMLTACEGNLRRLFNTSGQDYRALNFKEKLPEITESEALQLLSQNGNLIKRPFLLDDARSVALIGFQEDEWSAAIKS